MKQKLVLFLLLYTALATAQITIIPDPVFEQVLISQGIDSDGIVNGQILSSDVLGVTSLTITSPSDAGTADWITDLAGIEAFTNLESLTINQTMIEELDISTMPNLKYLNCVDNMLTSLDVSNNPSLEYLNITSGGDVYPFNNFSEINLSNNPNIRKLIAWGEIQYINLKNGNNNPDMRLEFASNVMFDPPVNFTHTCIEIDDEDAAQSNQFPYNEWTILYSYHTYSFTETCFMETEEFNNSNITIYPNPTSDMLYFNTINGLPLDKVILFDISGRVVKEFTNTDAGISVVGLAKGLYTIQIVSGNITQIQKIILK